MSKKDRRSELGRIIEENNLKPIPHASTDYDLISGKRYRKLFNEFKAYDKRRQIYIKGLQEEIDKLKTIIKSQEFEIKKKNDRISFLKDQIGKRDWKQEMNLPLPPPEMI